MRIWIAAAIAFAALGAQDEAPTGSISGYVRDAATGQSLASAGIDIDSEPSGQFSDERGRYSLSNIPEGKHYVAAHVRKDVVGQIGKREEGRSIAVARGANAVVDLLLPRLASLEGTVLDEQRRPVKGALVALMQKTYVIGVLRLQRIASAATNEQGIYHFRGVPANEPLLLFAGRLKAQASDTAGGGAISPVDTYYPHSASPDTAEEVMLLPDEARTRTDIRLVAAPVFCASGEARGMKDTAVVDVMPEGGFGEPMATDVTKPDGAFRICGLPSGEYRLHFKSEGKPNGRLTASLIVSINKADSSGLSVTLTSPRTVTSEMVWTDDAPPDKGAYLMVLFQSRFGLGEPLPPAAGSAVEVFSAEPAEPYQIQAIISGHTAVVKDVLAGDRSVLHQTVQPPLANLRVIATRGIKVTAVADDHDHPAAFANFAIAPADAANESEFAGAALFGHADQYGSWTSGALLPGRYVIFAAHELLDDKAYRIDRLWAARSHATTVEIQPNSNATVKVNVEDPAAR